MSAALKSFSYFKKLLQFIYWSLWAWNKLLTQSKEFIFGKMYCIFACNWEVSRVSGETYIPPWKKWSLLIKTRNFNFNSAFCFWTLKENWFYTWYTLPLCWNMKYLSKQVMIRIGLLFRANKINLKIIALHPACKLVKHWSFNLNLNSPTCPQYVLV